MTLKLAITQPEPGIDHTIDAPASAAARDCPDPGRATYRFLTGIDPEDATIETDHDFDAHILASILSLASTEEGSLSERVGLAPHEIDAMARRWFPHAHRILTGAAGNFVEDEETALLRNLLRSYVSRKTEISGWLACLIARRALEPNHLWEDLGLRERSELTRMLHRHFGPLAERNINNMRWKRFFYRMLCEDDGFLMCATPVCTECNEFNECFGEESGESRLAQRRRDQDSRPLPERSDPIVRSLQEGRDV